MREIIVGFGVKKDGKLTEIVSPNEVSVPLFSEDCKYRNTCKNARESCSTEYSTCPEYLSRLNIELIRGE